MAKAQGPRPTPCWLAPGQRACVAVAATAAPCRAGRSGLESRIYRCLPSFEHPCSGCCLSSPAPRWRPAPRSAQPRPVGAPARTAAQRPRDPHREHARRPAAVLQPFRDDAAGAVSAAAAVGPQPRVERRHADAAAAPAQLRRRHAAPDGAEGRRDARVLRRQRVVRGRSRPAEVREGSRGLHRAAPGGEVQRRGSARAWRWCRRSLTSASSGWCMWMSTRAIANWRDTPKRCAE